MRTRTRNWTARSLLWLAVATLLLSACGGPDQAILDTLSPVCRGQGVPEAADYKASEGSNTLVLLDSAGEQHSWTGRVPEEWWPESVADTGLVVCVGEEQENLIQTCQYVGGPPIERFQYSVAYQVRAAQTAEVLFTYTIEGNAPRACRQSEPVNLTRLAGSHVSWGDMESQLESWANP